MEITRTFDLLDRYSQYFNRDNVLNAKRKGQWVGYSAGEYIEMAHDFSYGLMSMGYKTGDKIATVSNNRPEWNIVDMGMAMLGVVHVPVFPSLNKEEYTYILRHSDARFVIVSDIGLFRKIKEASRDLKTVEGVYSFDDNSDSRSWMEILERGKKRREEFVVPLGKIKDNISPNDFATLIYTSGTTGVSKGVMLSHENMVKNFLAASQVFELGPDDRYLSILPLCHVGGRLGNYQTQYSGSSIYYAENMGTIAANMKEIHADGFDTVPRILEKIFDNVVAKGKNLTGIKKVIYFWAIRLGLKYKMEEDSSWFYKKKHALADKMIYSKWREALGGKLRMAGCGGASLQPRLERVFWAAGIKIINMYGLTETSPIITINRQRKPMVKLGTVGPLIDGVELKIADDGEILTRGHNVMLGYYKDVALTREMIDPDGWFHTGDIGSLEEGKFLAVTDRKKEIFKLSNGKYIAPQVIEGKLKESVFIDQTLVVGEGEKFPSALISPDFSYLMSWCKASGLEYINHEDIILLPQVREVFKEEVKKLNKTLSNPERIGRHILVPHVWGPETGELSPTLKLKRKHVMAKYEKNITEIYIQQGI